MRRHCQEILGLELCLRVAVSMSTVFTRPAQDFYFDRCGTIDSCFQLIRQFFYFIFCCLLE